ncbi:MAG: cation transporter [Desulfobacterales bacterium]|nr:cation transporter [Desulfobacterales bacterium]
MRVINKNQENNCSDNQSIVSDHCTNNHGHHHHNHIKDAIGSRLLFTLILNLIIPLSQFFGGIYAGSVALISDATHNFSDFIAVFISLIAYRMGKKGATIDNTFGYRRAEIFAALLNASILIVFSIFILREAFHRFSQPEIVSGEVVMCFAGIGILGNGLSAWMLYKDSKHSLNIRGAFIHMLGDFFTSIAVLISGAIMFFVQWYWLDPLLSVMIVVFIFVNAWSILKASVKILMNATPEGIDLQAIQESLSDIQEIIGVHYLHTWQLSSSDIAFSCHLVVEDQLVSHTEKLVEQINHLLLHKFGINHPILQIETKNCGEGSLFCEMSCNGKEKQK